jgi:FkbM family methyltransferase
MYCGSLEHAEVLARLALRFPRLAVNVNLFWLSFKLTPEYAHKWQSFIERLDEGISAGNFIATLPTFELRDHLAEFTGCILPVAPHPSTGITDRAFEDLSQKNLGIEGRQMLNVLFPSAPRPEKGYLTSIESVRLLCSESEAFRPIIRHAPTFTTPKQFVQPLSNVAGAEVVEGELTDDEFLKLFARSDIVVLPYTPDAFAERTSGLLIDSMYFGFPCVVIRGTWLGNLTEKFGSGVVVDELTPASLVAGVRAIAANYEDYQLRARKAGREYFSKNSWSAFSKFLRNPVESEGSSQAMKAFALVGPHWREQQAHWDETNGIAELFSSVLSGTVMIDVGAHHGSALMPFLNKAWSVFAFEPDEKNRAKLTERLAKHKSKYLVSLDTRCVSNKPQTGVSFFTSEQSTGISGLSAFHETHVEAQKVDITTLTEFFQDKPLPAVDFLKIDTEGHDLFVLQGFPWDRGQPAVIECEFEDTKTVPLGYTFHDLARFLVDKGYTVYVSEWHPIVRYGIRHDWNRLVRYPSDLADEKGWGNLLAFREPIDENDLVAAVRKVLKVSTGETAKPAALSVKASVPATPTISAKPAAMATAQTGVQAFKIVPGPHFNQLSANLWRYTHSDAAQKLWLAVFDGMGSTAGRSFVAGIRLKSNRAMTVDVSIGRYGNTDYEGAKIRIMLPPGAAQIVQVRKEFAKPHTALKVQVEVLGLEGGGTADLTIDSIYLNETLASIRRRVAEHDLNLRVANRLFREGDYSAAMGLYLLLHQQRPLKMYPDNALMAARKLGMDSVRTVDDLLQCVS